MVKVRSCPYPDVYPAHTTDGTGLAYQAAINEQERQDESRHLFPASSDQEQQDLFRDDPLRPPLTPTFSLLTRVTAAGGFKAGSVGLGAALIASFAAQRFGVRAYRQLTLPLKAFAVTSATTASFIIGADSASRNYELSKYAEGSGTQLEKETHRDIMAEKAAGIYEDGKIKQRMEGLSTQQALLEWSKEHRYSVVIAGWGASMVGSFAYIAATPLSFAQKLVQARMIAQGLTVAVLLASAGLSAMPGPNGEESEDEQKREFRENTMYKWKKGSKHDIEEHEKAEHVK
ncbi:hypothetical protein P7C70_g2572, partial [Phenoliferia sp. Uapishka_3]